MRLIQTCTNVSHLTEAACFETTLRRVLRQIRLRRWGGRDYWKIHPHLPYGVTLRDGRSRTSFTRTSTLQKRAAWTISKLQPAIRNQTVDTILPICFRVVSLCLNVISRDVVTLTKLEAGQQPNWEAHHGNYGTVMSVCPPRQEFILSTNYQILSKASRKLVWIPRRFHGTEEFMAQFARVGKFGMNGNLGQWNVECSLIRLAVVNGSDV